MKNYYKILEIPDFSDEQTIKKAYRNLSKKYHPDVNPNQQAHQYFIVVKEAYEYLSNPDNKRYLDNILLRQQQINRQSKTNHQRQYPAPKLHYFKANTTYYSVNDLVIIEWRVEGAMRVEIDYLGEVNPSGKHGLKLKKIQDNLKIGMRVIGFDQQQYYHSLTFIYRDKNPNVEAWRTRRKINPDVNEAHFKTENIFGLHGRVSVETFRQRIFTATAILMFILWIGYAQNWSFLILLGMFAYFFLFRVNITKRLRDFNGTISTSILPNPPAGIKQLFNRQGVRHTNDFGPYRAPKYKSIKSACQQILVRFKKFPIAVRLTILVTFLSLLFPLIPYLQPIQTGDFQQAKLGTFGTEHFLLLNDHKPLPIEHEVYYHLNKGNYSELQINQFYFTKEISTVKLTSVNHPTLDRTLYYGLLGTHSYLIPLMLFLLLLEWQLIKHIDYKLHPKYLSILMWMIFFIVVASWGLM